MIAAVKHPDNPAADPVRVAVALSAADMSALKTGSLLALCGRELGLEGTDFLFLAALRSEGQARNRLKYVLHRLDPQGVPENHRFGVAKVLDQFFNLPVMWRTPEMVHAVCLAGPGYRSLLNRKAHYYRERLFRAGALRLRQGTHPLPVAEAAIRRAFDRGHELEPGSVEVTIRHLDGEEAGRWAKQTVGWKASTPDGEAGVYRLDPPAWLGHWNDTENPDYRSGSATDQMVSGGTR